MLLKDLIKLVDDIRINCVGEYAASPYDKYFLDVLSSVLVDYQATNKDDTAITKKILKQLCQQANNYIVESWYKLIKYMEDKCND